MLRFLTFAMLISVMLYVYFRYIRDWVKSQSPWMASNYDQIDGFYAKLMMLGKQAWGTSMMFVALILPDIAQFLTEIGVIDFSSFLPGHIATRVTQGIVVLGVIVRFLILKTQNYRQQQ